MGKDERKGPWPSHVQVSFTVVLTIYAKVYFEM